MYFEAYLKNRNSSISNYPIQNQSNNGIDTNNKFTTLRPPNLTTNLVINKPPTFNQMRSDNNKANSSTHIYLSAAKNATIAPRVTSNLPIRSEVNTGNFGIIPFSRHQVTEQQKYICHSPAKANNRASAGLVFEEIPQNRFDFRRSQSINEIKANDLTRQNGVSNYNSNIKHGFQYQSPADNRVSNSPIQIKFNPSCTYDTKGRLIRRDTSEGLSFTNRDDRQDKNNQISLRNTYRDGSSDYIFQNRTQKGISSDYKPPKYQPYIPRTFPENNKYDLQFKKFQTQLKKGDETKYGQQFFKFSGYSSIAPTENLKKQSSQQYLKKYSISKLPELDKTLDQDIQILKLANRKSEQILDRQLSKNTYLNQLFDQKSSKNTEDKIIEVKQDNLQKKQFQKKISKLQEEIQLKNKQIFEKNKDLFEKSKQISQKSKIIIEKNKQIESMAVQISQLYARLQKTVSNQQFIKKQACIQQLEKQVGELKKKIGNLQIQIKQIQKQNDNKQLQKLRYIQILQKKYEEINNKIIEIQKQNINIKQQKNRFQKLIQQLASKDQQNQQKITIIFHQKQQLIQFHQSQIKNINNNHQQQKHKLQLKYEAQLLQLNNSFNQKINNLQISINQSFSKNNSLQNIIHQLQHSNAQNKDLLTRISNQYSEIGSILLLESNFKHESLVNKLKQSLQILNKLQNIQAKEIPKNQQIQINKCQQDHFQRRYQQLSRQLKKMSARLTNANFEAQQNIRIARDSNHNIVMMNLMNLNQKYKYELQKQ